MTDYRTLYESAPIGLWQIRLSDGEIISANKKACDILGFKNFQDLSKKPALEVSKHHDLITEINSSGEIKDFPVTLKKKDGKQINAILSLKLSANKEYVEGSLRDVSDELSLEAKLVPHIQKMSILRQNIIQKLESFEPAYSFSKSL